MPPHRVVLDTNVLISGTLFGGKPREVLRLVIGGGAVACLSPAMLDELREVLIRPKFRLPPELVHAIINQIQLNVTMIYPKHVERIVEPDPDDDVVIACAVEAGADFIVTGDPHLLRLKTHLRTKIVSPAEYLASSRL